MGDQFATVASPGSLTLALETLAIGSQYGGKKRETQLDQVRYLEAQFAPLWGGMGAVAEAFGTAYAEAKEVDKAIDWYRAAVDAGDGRASFKAAEQLGNHLVRRGERNKDPAAARADIEAGIGQLERLAAVQSTIERESLLGSAYKRLTMVEWRAGRKRAADAALNSAVKHYGNAEGMARKAGADNLFYPAKNGISCELRASFLAKLPVGISEERLRYANRWPRRPPATRIFGR
ncbi:MAG: tetratricopeptide repeat-containing protein [Gammaproteobacteria bacterium]